LVVIHAGFPLFPLHFHYWDVSSSSTSGHNAKTLGDIVKTIPKYYPSDYISDLAESGATLKKAVFVEALSDKPNEEAKWVS